MYFAAENHIVEKERKKVCYLPEGTDWYDYWSGQYYTGGREVTAKTPLDRIPIFVKAGAILPVTDGLQYADEKTGKPLEIQVYPGAGGSFLLYEDEGNNYNYENGGYSLIPMRWNASKRQFTLGERKGEFEGMEKKRYFLLNVNGERREITYDGEEITVSFS